MADKPSHFTPAMAIGLALGGIFFVLMAMRLGVFHGNAHPKPMATAGVQSHDTWMVIHQKDRRIGHSHRRLSESQNGYSLTDDTVMRINTMGMVQDLSIRTRAILNKDLSLSRFEFALTSNLFSFQATGQVSGKALTVTVNDNPLAISLDEPIFLSSGILEAAAASEMPPGSSQSFRVFDPAAMGTRPVRVTLTGTETLRIGKNMVKTRRFDVDFMGTGQVAWVDDQGNVVREKGFMDITLTRVSKDEALEGAPLAATEDLTQLAAVPSDRAIAAPRTLDRLRIRISGITDPLALDGGRQHYANGLLLVEKEPVPDPEKIHTDHLTEFLKPAPMIQSDHPRIREAVARIVDDRDRPFQRAQKIMAWIHDHIRRRPVLSMPDALQTLTHRMGDCNEHAMLFAAMARAAGVPARIEAGVVYLDGKFFYHAWNSIYLGVWVTADSLMNQLPADATHIRFIQGATDRQLDLVQVMGKIRFSILEPTGD